MRDDDDDTGKERRRHVHYSVPPEGSRRSMARGIDSWTFSSLSILSGFFDRNSFPEQGDKYDLFLKTRCYVYTRILVAGSEKYRSSEISTGPFDLLEFGIRGGNINVESSVEMCLDWNSPDCPNIIGKY